MKMTKKGRILFCSATAILIGGAVWIFSKYKSAGSLVLSGAQDFLMVLLMFAAMFLLMASWRVE